MISKLRRYRYDVPWCVPPWGKAEFTATMRSLVRGQLVRGPAVSQFARASAEALGVAYGVPFGLGRVALEAGLRALGIGEGDEVVVPSYVCWSVIEAVLQVRGRPRFADVGVNLNVTVESIEAALSRRSKVVIVPHLFGNPAPIDAIGELLEARGIPMIDDAAQSIGATVGNRPVGSFGVCGILSCGPGKPLAGAGGGILVTQDGRLARRAAELRTVAESSATVAKRVLSWWWWRRLRRHTLPLGVLLSRLAGDRDTPAPYKTLAMANIDAAIGLEQLAAVERNQNRRRHAAERLMLVLGPLSDLVVTSLSPNAAVMKLVLILPEHGPSRNTIIDLFAQGGIEAQGGYRPCHHYVQPDLLLSRTDAVWDRVVCIPLETELRSTGRISDVIEGCRGLLDRDRWTAVSASGPRGA